MQRWGGVKWSWGGFRRSNIICSGCVARCLRCFIALGNRRNEVLFIVIERSRLVLVGAYLRQGSWVESGHSSRYGVPSWGGGRVHYKQESVSARIGPPVALHRYLPERGRCCCFVRVSLDTIRPQSHHLARSALFDRPCTDSIRQDSGPRNHLRVIYCQPKALSYLSRNCEAAKRYCNCGSLCASERRLRSAPGADTEMALTDNQ